MARQDYDNPFGYDNSDSYFDDEDPYVGTGYYIANPDVWPSGQPTAPAGWNAVVKPEDPDMAPPPPPPPPSGTGGGGGGSAPSGFSVDGFQWPEFNALRFNYPEFAAPTLEDAYAEPGYEFARKEGMRALENSAAGRGTLRTGGTLKDLVGWGNKFAEQNYSNAYNRKADIYKTNYGTASGVFDRNYRASYDEFAPKEKAAHATFDDLYRRWKAELDANTSLATAGAGV